MLTPGDKIALSSRGSDLQYQVIDEIVKILEGGRTSYVRGSKHLGRQVRLEKFQMRH